jgi:hypothetical protein
MPEVRLLEVLVLLLLTVLYWDQELSVWLPDSLIAFIGTLFVGQLLLFVLLMGIGIGVVLEAFVIGIGIGELLELFVFGTLAGGEFVDLFVDMVVVVFNGTETAELFVVFAEIPLVFPFA